LTALAHSSNTRDPLVWTGYATRIDIQNSATRPTDLTTSVMSSASPLILPLARLQIAATPYPFFDQARNIVR
jgi:hypothetical protein